MKTDIFVYFKTLLVLFNVFSSCMKLVNGLSRSSGHSLFYYSTLCYLPSAISFLSEKPYYLFMNIASYVEEHYMNVCF